jgi:general secretion pathway protein A
MYTHFWGFREKPFRQLPNPDFLFLSATHEEALAHLNYALAEGEGFLMITGEVGTGKSTLCRSFFHKLDADTACAYLFNSRLDSLQLLKSINSEFGIPADAGTTHDLIDILNSYLIELRAAGRKAVIVIDEAQNLPVESLEQVRLLSNLETTQAKLLHLVLVGQPELADMIDSFALRQLGQRIQLACQLRPLTFDETVQYIQHRINLVSEKPQMPFEKGALKAIYAFSKGVPRLINSACDRMLLAAYLKNRPRISAAVASRIVEELQHRGRPTRSKHSATRVAVTTILAAVAVMASLLMLLDGPIPFLSAKAPQNKQASQSAGAPSHVPAAPPDSLAAKEPAADPIEPSPGTVTASSPVVDKGAENMLPLDDWGRLIEGSDTRRLALEAVLRQWGLEPHGDMMLPELDDAAFFTAIAERHGLSILRIGNDIDALQMLNLPAVIALDLPGIDPPLYVGLVGVREDGRFALKIHGHDRFAAADALTLMQRWRGKAYIPWKNYIGYQGVIPGGAPRAAVVALKQLLWEIGYVDVVIDDRYDLTTRHAVREIQTRHGLAVDGLVGDMTKIVLFNEKNSLPIPHLSQRMTADDGMD